MNQRPSGYEPDELPLLHPAPKCATTETEIYVPECGLSPRPISTARLNPLRDLHLRPIKQIVFLWPYSSRGRMGDLVLGRASRLYAFSAYPHQTWLPGGVLLAEQPAHQRSVPPGPLVLGRASLKSPAPATDRDRTVSRRSEPSSRAALTGEQPDPWDRLQPQDATSRHRGAKPRRRYELLGEISLLSPG